jgi:hypothetical protein
MEACTAAAMEVGKRENIDEKPSFRSKLRQKILFQTKLEIDKPK